jgi:hypothetical protein
LMVIVALALLSACSKMPSEADARVALGDQVTKKSSGLARLTTFQKKDGQQMQVLGISMYTIEYEATVEFIEPAVLDPLSGLEFPFAAGKPTSRGEIIRKNAEAEARAKNDPFGMKPRDFTENVTPQGTMIEINGNVVFEKKESGWTVESIKSRQKK